MKFELKQAVQIIASKTPAVVYGRAEYTKADPSYLLAYVDTQGDPRQEWWSEEHIEAKGEAQ